MKAMQALAALALVGVLLATAGCGAVQDAGVTTVEQTAPGSAGAPAPTEERFLDGSEGEAYSTGAVGGAGVQPVSPADRMVIRNGSLELRVKDVEGSLAAVKRTALASGAEVSDLSASGGVGEVPVAESFSADGPTYATITLRVPAEKLDALTTALAKLGTVLSQTESSSDVTEQAVDLEARLRNLRAEETRLRSFLDRAEKITDLLAVETELSRVRGEIEAMDAQLTYLERQVAKATLVVTLSEPSPVTGTESPWFGFREAVRRGVQGALGLVQVMITVVIAVLPLAVVVGLLVWVLVSFVRRSNARSRARYAASSHPDADADTTESATSVERAE